MERWMAAKRWGFSLFAIRLSPELLALIPARYGRLDASGEKRQPILSFQIYVVSQLGLPWRKAQSVPTYIVLT